MSPVNMASFVALDDFEPVARERLSHVAYEYIAGGACDEITLRDNRAAFDRIRLRPRVLVDVSKIDTTLNLLSRSLPFPILLAPTAYHRLFHPEGENATIRGANEAGATLVISSFATTTVEEIASVARVPPWFQLYVQRDRGFTKALVQRASAAGCHALCVTVDTPVIGTRNREARAGFALPAGLECVNLAGLGDLARASHRPREREIYSPVFDPALNWEDIEWLCSLSSMPVVLKGIMTGEDATLALQSGASALIVSNHGARNLDTVPATIDALPGVFDAVGGRMPILVDGGIRRGTDVLKALALGATAVLIGRPYLYGLAAGGADGVRRAVDILRTEFEMAMALVGAASLNAIPSRVLW